MQASELSSQNETILAGVGLFILVYSANQPASQPRHLGRKRGKNTNTTQPLLTLCFCSSSLSISNPTKLAPFRNRSSSLFLTFVCMCVEREQPHFNYIHVKLLIFFIALVRYYKHVNVSIQQVAQRHHFIKQKISQRLQT